MSKVRKRINLFELLDIEGFNEDDLGEIYQEGWEDNCYELQPIYEEFKYQDSEKCYTTYKVIFQDSNDEFYEGEYSRGSCGMSWGDAEIVQVFERKRMEEVITYE